MEVPLPETQTQAPETQTPGTQTQDIPLTAQSYNEILTRIVEEERRLIDEKWKNDPLIPQVVQKTACKIPINKPALQYFNNPTMTTNFSRYVKEKRVEQSAQAILNQCSQFVSYVKCNLKELMLNKPTQELLTITIQNHRILFHEYLETLNQSGLKAPSMLTRISSLVHLVNWMMMTNNDVDFQLLIEVNKRLEIARARYQHLQRREHENRSLDKLIKARKWVESGIPGLQDMMSDSWLYFDALICLSRHHALTCHQYSWAVGYTLASLWVYAINSRSQSIEKMTMKAMKEIQSSGFHLSNEFKTSSCYQFQIVSPTNILELYIKYIRPHVIGPDIDSDDAVVFPSFRGTPLSSGEATKKINNVFATYGYDISITTLRDMLSTYVETLYQDGKLTEEGKEIYQ